MIFVLVAYVAEILIASQVIVAVRHPESVLFDVQRIHGAVFAVETAAGKKRSRYCIGVEKCENVLQIGKVANGVNRVEQKSDGLNAGFVYAYPIEKVLVSLPCK